MGAAALASMPSDPYTEFLLPAQVSLSSAGL